MPEDKSVMQQMQEAKAVVAVGRTLLDAHAKIIKDEKKADVKRLSKSLFRR